MLHFCWHWCYMLTPACVSAQATAQKQRAADDEAMPLSHRLAAAVAAKLEAQCDAARTKEAAAETAAQLATVRT